jgi:hypothetical protein
LEVSGLTEVPAIFLEGLRKIKVDGVTDEIQTDYLPKTCPDPSSEGDGRWYISRLLCCDTVQNCRRISKFQRNILPPSSGSTRQRSALNNGTPVGRGVFCVVRSEA